MQLEAGRLSFVSLFPSSIAAAAIMAAPAPPAAADLRFNPEAVPAAGFHPLHEDRWETSRANPMISSLPFLDWDTPAAPALPSCPRYQIQGVVLATLGRKDDAASRHGFYTLDPIEHEYGHVAASAAAHLLARGGIFGSVRKDISEVREAVRVAALDLSSIALERRRGPLSL